MIDIRGLYTCTWEQPLAPGQKTTADAAFGKTYNRYEVRQITDVNNLKAVRAYRIVCTQRIVVPNSTTFELAPQSTTMFNDYPALLSSQFAFKADGTDQDLRLVD